MTIPLFMNIPILQTWAQLLEWERQLHPETADSVRLKKFSGDAKKISPKVSPNGSAVPCRIDNSTQWDKCVHITTTDINGAHMPRKTQRLGPEA